MNPSSSRQPPRRPPLPPPSSLRTPPPSSSPNPNSSTPPPSSSLPFEGGKRWALERVDGSLRIRKREIGESILGNRQLRFLDDDELHHMRNRIVRNPPPSSPLNPSSSRTRSLNSTPELSNNQDQRVNPIRGHGDILFDKCQSNEVDWKDYPFFLNSLIDDFPNVLIDDLISSLKFFKKSKLEEMEQDSKIAATQNRMKDRPDLVRSLMTSKAPSTDCQIQGQGKVIYLAPSND